MNKKGFTLVELMVVIAIIAVLAAVAAPQVFRQMSKGRTAGVESFYNSVKTACTTYFSDTARWPATGTGDFFAAGGIANWDGPYLSSWPANNAWGGANTYTNAAGQLFGPAPNANERYITIGAVPTVEANRMDTDVDGAAGVATGVVRLIANGGNWDVRMLISRDGATN